MAQLIYRAPGMSRELLAAVERFTKTR